MTLARGMGLTSLILVSLALVRHVSACHPTITILAPANDTVVDIGPFDAKSTGSVDVRFQVACATFPRDVQVSVLAGASVLSHDYQDTAVRITVDSAGAWTCCRCVSSI